MKAIVMVFRFSIASGSIGEYKGKPGKAFLGRLQATHSVLGPCHESLSDWWALVPLREALVTESGDTGVDAPYRYPC